MDLREIEVRNFRAFESASIRLPAHGLVLVAGANNAGKSALLSAPDVVAGIAPDIQSWTRKRSADPARVAATFSLAPDERSIIFAASAQTDDLVAAGAGAQLQFVFESQGAAMPLMAEILCEWPGRGLVPLSTVHVDATRRTYQARVIRGMVEGNVSGANPLELIGRGSSYGAPVLLATIYEGRQLPELDPLIQMLQAWRSRF